MAIKELQKKVTSRFNEMLQSEKIDGKKITYELLASKFSENGFEICSAQIGRWSRGENNIPDKRLHQLQKIFPHIRYEWLCGDDDFKTFQDYLRHIAYDKITADDIGVELRKCLLQYLVSVCEYDLKIKKANYALEDPRNLNEYLYAQKYLSYYWYFQDNKNGALFSIPDYELMELNEKLSNYAKYCVEEMLARYRMNGKFDKNSD